MMFYVTVSSALNCVVILDKYKLEIFIILYRLKFFDIFSAKKRAIYDQFGEEGLRSGVPDSGTGWFKMNPQVLRIHLHMIQFITTS